MTDLSNFDEVMKLLDDKVVRTDRGAYIKVTDLKELVDSQKARKGVRDEEAEDDKRLTTFEKAKEAAKRDPELKELFKKSPTAAEALNP